MIFFREGECNKCFKDAVVNNMKKGSKPNKEAMMTDLTACADQFLATKYADCNAMMKSEDPEKKEVFECYIRVLVGNLVQTCSKDEDIEEATAETLDEVMECGQEKVKEFVMENAGPKALKMIGNMLGDKEDDNDSDEDVRG